MDPLRQRMTELMNALLAEPMPLHEPGLSIWLGRAKVAEMIRVALAETAP